MKLKFSSDDFCKLASRYFMFQAFAVAVWWIALLTIPGAISLFHPTAWPDDSLLAFGLSDALLLVAGSLLAGIAIQRKLSFANMVTWCVAATSAYPTLYCLGVSVITNEAWIATSLMTCMTGLSFVFASSFGLSSISPAAIREVSWSKQASISWTLIQTIVFWSTFLWILPKGIFECQLLVGIKPFGHFGQTELSIALFLVASCVGILSGMTMASLGRGTPLPTATASRLVVAGPYRFVRNPMAVAGISQGVAVGWFLGSVPVIIYSILGMFVWHFFVRPVEEADLVSRFGTSYIEYQRKVGLWIPRFRRKSNANR